MSVIMIPTTILMILFMVAGRRMDKQIIILVINNMEDNPSNTSWLTEPKNAVPSIIFSIFPGMYRSK